MSALWVDAREPQVGTGGRRAAQEAFRRFANQEVQGVLFPHNKSSKVHRALQRRSDEEGGGRSVPEVESGLAARGQDLWHIPNLFPASVAPLIEESRQRKE